MPVCEGCGEEFPKGGAYTTHVNHCGQVEEANRPESGSQEERIQKLESKVEDLQGQLDTQAKFFNDELDRHREELDDHREELDAVPTALTTNAEMITTLKEEQDDLKEALVETVERLVVMMGNLNTNKEFGSYDEMMRRLDIERATPMEIDEETEQAIKELVADANQETEEASEVN